jgi:hypothetical protein
MTLRGQTLHRIDDGVRLNHAEIWVEVACRSTKRSRIERRRLSDHQVLVGGVG